MILIECFSMLSVFKCITALRMMFTIYELLISFNPFFLGLRWLPHFSMHYNNRLLVINFLSDRGLSYEVLWVFMLLYMINYFPKTLFDLFNRRGIFRYKIWNLIFFRRLLIRDDLFMFLMILLQWQIKSVIIVIMQDFNFTLRIINLFKRQLGLRIFIFVKACIGFLFGIRIDLKVILNN